MASGQHDLYEQAVAAERQFEDCKEFQRWCILVAGVAHLQLPGYGCQIGSPNLKKNVCP